MKALFTLRNKLFFYRMKYTFMHFFSFIFISTIISINSFRDINLPDLNTIYIIYCALKLPIFRLLFALLKEEKQSGYKALYFKQNGLSTSTCIKYYLSWFAILHTGILLSAFHYTPLVSFSYLYALLMYFLYHLSKVSQIMFFSLVFNDSMFCLLFTMFGSIIAPICYAFKCSYWAMIIINIVYPESAMYYMIGSSGYYYYRYFTINPRFADFSTSGFIVLSVSTVIHFILVVVIDYYSLRKTFRRFKLTNEADTLHSINKTEKLLPSNDNDDNDIKSISSNNNNNNKESLIINKISIAQTCQSKQLNDINIELNENDIMCILGYEDKTTLLKIISGELAPHSGDVVYNGFSVNKNPEMFVHNVLYVSHSMIKMFIDDLSLYDNIIQFMNIHKCSYIKNDINDTLNYLSLLAFKSKLYKNVTEEDKVKLLIACAICSQKKIIIFDEAFTGLNIASRIKALELIKRIQSNKIIIIGTTTLGEINYLLHSKVAIMKQGRLMCVGNYDSIKDQYQFGFNLKIKFNDSDYQGALASSSNNANDVFISHKLLYYNIKTILPSAEILYNHKSVLSINFYETNIESINQLLQMFKEQPNPLIEDISLTTRTMKEYFYYNNTPNTSWLDIKDSNNENENQQEQNQFAINDSSIDQDVNKSALNINKTESSILSLPKTSSSFCTQLSLEFTRHIAYFLSHKLNIFTTMFYCFCGPLVMICSFNNTIENIIEVTTDTDHVVNLLTPFYAGMFIFSLHLIRYPYTDRTNGFKTLYKLSNGSVIAYWLAHYMFDYIQYCFIIIIASPFFSVVEPYFFYMVAYLLVYILGYLPFMYMFSFFLQKFNVAIKIIPFIILSFVPLGILEIGMYDHVFHYVMPQTFWVVGMTFERLHGKVNWDELFYNFSKFCFNSLFLASGVNFIVYWIIVMLLEYNIPWKIIECCNSCCMNDNFTSMAFIMGLQLNIKPYAQYKVNQAPFVNFSVPIISNNVYLPNNNNMQTLNNIDNSGNSANSNQNIIASKPTEDNTIAPPPNLYAGNNGVPTTTTFNNVVQPNFTYNISNNNPYQLQYNNQPVLNYGLQLSSNKNHSITLTSIKKRYTIFCCTKAYGLRNASLSLEKKEGTCLIGLPESGKSTLFKVLVNETPSNEGKAYIFNKGDALRKYSTVRDSIGYIPQSNETFPEGITIFNVLLYHITLTGYHDYMKLLKHLLDVTGLYVIRNEYIENISNGDKRKLQFAIMIIKNPELMLLDTPTVGVEPSKQLEMWNTIEQMKMNKDVNGNFNIMLISNDQYEINALSDSVAIMKHGCVLYKNFNEKVIKEYAPGYNVNVAFDVNDNDIGNEINEEVYNELSTLMERSRNALITAAGINPLLYWRYTMLVGFLREIKECAEKIVLKEIKNDFSFLITVYKYELHGEEHVKNNIKLLQKLYSMKMNGEFRIKELTVREEEINDIVWYM